MIFDTEGLDKAELERQKRREWAEIAADVTSDFNQRREARRSIENCWLLNLNFYNGNQYCDISPEGLENEDAQFYWQSRRVFNHIAPTVDARITKLEKLKPELTVRAFSDEEGDVKAAKLATGILRYVQDRVALDAVSSRVTTWAELC